MKTIEMSRNQMYCIHVSGHDPLTFLSCPLSFVVVVVVVVVVDWVGVLWPQLSKVLKLARWARRVLFPPVSLQ